MTRNRKQTTVPQSGAPRPTNATQTAVSPGDKRKPQRISADAIRLCAYQKWESAGKPIGDGIQFWLEAEQELMNGK